MAKKTYRFNIPEESYTKFCSFANAINSDAKSLMKMFMKITVLNDTFMFSPEKNIKTGTSIDTKIVLDDIEKIILTRFDEICKQHDYDMDTAMKLFIETTVTKNTIPFKITLPDNYEHIENKLILKQKYNTRITEWVDLYPENKREDLYDHILDELLDLPNITSITPKEYLHLSLFRFEKEKWLNEYLSDRDTRILVKRVNNSENPIKNKFDTYLRLKENYGRKISFIKNIQDLPLFTAMLENYKKLVIKPVNGSLSNGVMVVNRDEITSCYDCVQNILLNEHCRYGFLAEEIIKQSDDMAKLNPASVNTLRVLVLNYGSKIKTYIVLRIGTTDSISDAINLGGVTCGLNQKTGRVINAATPKGIFITKHPLLGYDFTDITVPDIKQAKKFAIEMAAKLPGYNYLGWDLAHTNDGWKIIELNTKSGIMEIQTAVCHGLKKDLVRLLKAHNQPTDFPIVLD